MAATALTTAMTFSVQAVCGAQGVLSASLNGQKAVRAQWRQQHKVPLDRGSQEMYTVHCDSADALGPACAPHGTRART